MVGRLSPSSSCGVCIRALGKVLGSFQIFLQEASSLQSIAVIAAGDSAMRQCACTILELVP